MVCQELFLKKAHSVRKLSRNGLAKIEARNRQKLTQRQQFLSFPHVFTEKLVKNREI
jgi:hypothetical protein